MNKKIEKEEPAPVNSELSDKELDSVSGGAIPTSVNSQITDAVT
jgi:bacteriocin-like protein